VNQVNALATGGLKPDLTLFFDITVEHALQRMITQEKGERIRNRMDAETADFYRRVRDAYLGIAGREPGRFKVIDANGSVDETHEKVVALVKKFLGVE
jgi:dTMP kinase